MRFRLFAWLLLPLAFAQSTVAQPGGECALTISGRVVDAHDRAPLAFAEVFVPLLAKGAVADAEGRYAITGLCPGVHLLRITHLGCETIEREVRLTDNLTLDLRLEHHASELRELEVIQNRPDEHVGQAREGLGRSALEQSGATTLGEALATMPGVNQLSTGPTIGKPVIHGLSGNRVLTLNQGIRQEDQQWGSEHAPSLDPFSAERITVVKGAASVQYGSDAIGGVVITEPVRLPREAGWSLEGRLLGNSNAQGGGAMALVQGGIAGLTGLGWRVQGTARRMGDSRAANYVLSNTGSREAALSAALGYHHHRWEANAYYSWFARDLGILRASHIGNLTDLTNAISNGAPAYISDFTYAIDAPRQTVQHHLIKAEASYGLSERDRLVLTYGYQANDRQEYDIRRGGRSGVPALDLFLATHTGELVLKHWLGAKLHGRAGLSGLVQENSNIPGTGIRPLIPDFTRRNGGIFIVEHLPVNDRLELEAGARLEGTHFVISRYGTDGLIEEPVHDFINQAFSLGSNWTVRDSLSVRFNLSSAYRPPHVSELYSDGLHHSAAAIEVGDPTLTSERAWKAVLDASAAAPSGWVRADISVHAALIDGYIYLRPDGTRLTIRGVFPVFRYTATDAFLSGMDATVRFRLTPAFTHSIRASTVHGRDRLNDEWLFLMPSDRIENTLAWTREGRGHWHSLHVEVTSSLVLEQHRIPLGLDFAAPPGTYHLVGGAFSLGRAVGRDELRIGLRGTNLLNATYRDYLDRFRYFADARGIDVMLWITYRFDHSRERGANEHAH